MLKTLENRIALITGASKGIGRATALEFAKQGAAVGLVARSKDKLEECVEEITAMGGKAYYCKADLCNREETLNSIREIENKLGPINILVNNAGNNILGHFLEQSEEQWRNQIELGLMAPYLLSRAVLPGMIKQKFGRIINIASINAKKSGKFISAYATAKHGLIGLTRSLAIDFAAAGVTVNAICPGWVETPLTKSTLHQRSELFGKSKEEITKFALALIPQGEIMQADEIVPLILFIAQNGSHRITGQAINICGGRVMH